MLFTKLKPAFHISTCNFYRRSTGAVRYMQQIDTFRNVMRKSVSKKQSKYKSPAVGTPSISLKDVVTSITPSRAPIKRRVTVLNKLFMRSITDVLSTGELTDILDRRDVQISHVKVAGDFNFVNAFWIPKGTDDDDIIQKELNEIAYPLRHILSKLRVIGVVPPIQFVKDKHYAFAAEVDKRLRMCGFEEKCLTERNELKVEFVLQTSLSPEVKEKVAEMELIEEYSEDEETMLPPMAMNVYNLDYNKILKNINVGIAKSGGARKTETNIPLSNIITIPTTSIAVEVGNAKELKHFIRQRKLSMIKMQRERNKQWKLDVLNTQLDEPTGSAETYEEILKEFLLEDYFDDFTEDSQDQQCQTSLYN